MQNHDTPDHLKTNPQIQRKESGSFFGGKNNSSFFGNRKTSQAFFGAKPAVIVQQKENNEQQADEIEVQTLAQNSASEYLAQKDVSYPTIIQKQTNEYDEYEKFERDNHHHWMKILMQNIKNKDDAFKKGLINYLTNAKILAGSKGRTLAAAEAAAKIPFSEESKKWVKDAINTNPDQVQEIRMAVGDTEFDKVAIAIIRELTQKLQTINKDRVANPTLKTYQNDEYLMKQLEVLSPLAAIQLKVVFAAEQDLESGNDSNIKRDSPNYGGNEDNWCGAFLGQKYKDGLSEKFKTMFGGVGGMQNFFTYQGMPKILDDDGKPISVQDYHKKNGSERQWIKSTVIKDSKDKNTDMDIRPGDIVLLDYKGGDNADHIQMVLGWDPEKRKLFTIDGNGGGYTIKKSSSTGNEKNEDEKIKEVEKFTGYDLGKGPGSGHIGVGVKDLNDMADPSDIKKRFPSYKYGKCQDNVYKKGHKDECDELYKKLYGERKEKEWIIVGIGRPSIEDFKIHTYSNK